MEIPKTDYKFDKNADEEVRKDFGVDTQKTSDLCVLLMPKRAREKAEGFAGLIKKYGVVNKELRDYWIKALEPFAELEGMKEALIKVRWGEFSEIYVAAKNLPEETKRKALVENKLLTKEDIDFLRNDWKVI